MDYNEIMDIAMLAGEILIKNGADTYRIEETVNTICSSNSFKSECFCIPTGLFVSVKSEGGGGISSVKRVKHRRVDLYRIELVNSFSRSLKECNMSYNDAMAKLREIDNAPNFNFPTRLIAASMTSFVYTLFFNGKLIDAAAASLIGFFIYFILEKISHIGFIEFIQYFLAGFLIGGISLLAKSFIPGIDKNAVISGAIMFLVPGMAFTNGIKDALYGDFLSSIARVGEALLVIIAVCAGIGASLALGMKEYCLHF